MSELGEAIAEALAGIVDHPLVGLAAQALLAAAVAAWLACAWWTWRDCALRTRDPVAPYLAAGAVLVATPLLFPFVLLVYRIVRPPGPDALEVALAIRAVSLNAMEPEASCPGCGSGVRVDWRRCPACGAELSTPCPACGRPVGTDWSICAWCAADLPSP